MEKGDRKVQYLAALCVSVATITMGMSSAWPTPVIPKFKANETDVEITPDGIAWMLSMGPPGFIVGSFVAGYTSDKLGRRATTLWSAMPYGTGMVIAAFALKSWLLYLTLFLWSCGTGMLSTAITLYFAEISDKDIRGKLQLLTKITFNLGSLLMMCIGPFLSYQALNYILLVLPISYAAACWWIPESPYFYLKEGKINAARKALMRLRGYKDKEVLENDLKQMQMHVNSEMRHSSSPKEMFCGRQYRKAIIISAGLKITQIMTGAVTIQQYLGLIMLESGINLKLATVIIVFGAVRFIVSIMPSFLVDRLGRRPLLIYSYIGTGVSLATVGFYFFLMEVVRVNPDSLTQYGFITFTGIISANIISTIGFQSLIHVIPGEIFPLNVKAIAMMSISVFGGVLGFIVARGYQALKDVIGLCGVFWVFAAVAFGGAIFSVFQVPETKGKSLREIQMQLQGDMYDDDDEVGANVFTTDENMKEMKESKVLNNKLDTDRVVGEIKELEELINREDDSKAIDVKELKEINIKENLESGKDIK